MPAPPATLELLARTFPSVQIVNAFGQTEMAKEMLIRGGENIIQPRSRTRSASSTRSSTSP